MHYLCGGERLPRGRARASRPAERAPHAPPPRASWCPDMRTDCGVVNDIQPNHPIRCRMCGYRILYKLRTKRCTRLRARWSRAPRPPRPLASSLASHRAWSRCTRPFAPQ
jgi:DNA-directed RNA polymerase subunit RPC12/RpoP